MITGEQLWITGASSGIGRALAIKLARQENLIFVSARSAEALLQLERDNNNIVAVPCDVTDADSVNSAAQQIARRGGYLDRAIINAGTCEYLDISAPDWGMVETVMRVNFLGAVNCVAAVLPLLEQLSRHTPGARPHLAVVASLASDVPFPRAEAYGASKAALKYFFESLRIDLSPRAIDITIIQPGFVETPLTSRNDFPMPFKLPIEAAVDVIAKKLAARPHRIRFPRRLSSILGLFSFFPRVWYRIAASQLLRNNGADVKMGARG